MTRTRDNISDNTIEAADLKIDISKRLVTRGGMVIDLSSKEYAILEYLVRNKGIVVSKEKIEEHIWNYDYEGSSDVIKVYIHHLRKKIDDSFDKKLLYTVKNVGYVIRED